MKGRDLGRYWNITRGDSVRYTQDYYFLPQNYLYTPSKSKLNEIVLFNAIGKIDTTIELIFSWITPDDSPSFKDEIHYPFAYV